MKKQKIPLIRIKGVTKHYGEGEVVTKVLHGIDLVIDQGDFVAIMGPSGSGKSTLMHILGFLDSLTGGQYFFKERNVSQLTEEELARYRNEEVGFIFQAFNLLPRTSVLENVLLPLVYTKKKMDPEKRAKEVLGSVGLTHRLSHVSNQLSGGEKQRVAIARALVNNPSIIFADEPTGNLDSKSGKQVMEILQDLNDDGKTIILVTHEKYTAEHAKRILRIKDGNIVSDESVGKRVIAKSEKELTK
ncbi:MAG TPA: ABC transporter ATP-binding protein [Patescibacteria group bacterium]|nr:ABC transporter ATP-binding protein [Patescibacteria group bacterium]